MVRNKNHDTPHYSGNYVKNFPVSALYLIQIYTTFREFVLTCIIETRFKFLYSYYFFRMSNDFTLALFNDVFNR
jgi:hypothetical protein